MIKSGVNCIKYAAESRSETFDHGLKIKGNIKESGLSIPCRVRLFDKESGSLIADIASEKNGDFKFSHLKEARFFIVAHHPYSQYNAVIQDNVRPK